MRQERGITQNIKDRSITYRDNAIGPTDADIRHSRRERVVSHTRDFLNDEVGAITLKSVLLVTAVFGGAALGGYLVAQGRTSGDNGIERTTSDQTKSQGQEPPKGADNKAQTPTQPSPKAGAAGAETLQNQETYTLLDIPSEKWAADTFGVPGTWSGLESSWDIQNPPGGDKYAHLKQNGDVHSLVDLTKDLRAVGQASIKEDNGSGNIPYESVVLRNQKARVKEITIRISDNPDALAKDSDAKLVAKEAVEQPGVQTLYCVTKAETTTAPTPAPTPTPSPTLPPAK